MECRLWTHATMAIGKAHSIVIVARLVRRVRASLSEAEMLLHFGKLCAVCCAWHVYWKIEACVGGNL